MIYVLKWIGIIAAAIVLARLLALVVGVLFTVTLAILMAVFYAITGVKYEDT